MAYAYVTHADGVCVERSATQEPSAPATPLSSYSAPTPGGSKKRLYVTHRRKLRRRSSLHNRTSLPSWPASPPIQRSPRWGGGANPSISRTRLTTTPAPSPLHWPPSLCKWVRAWKAGGRGGGTGKACGASSWCLVSPRGHGGGGGGGGGVCGGGGERWTRGWDPLQSVAECCRVLRCVAVRCSIVLHCVALCCSVLQCVAGCCSVLQRGFGLRVVSTGIEKLTSCKLHMSQDRSTYVTKKTYIYDQRDPHMWQTRLTIWNLASCAGRKIKFAAEK